MNLNYKLIEELRRGLTEDRRQRITELIAHTKASSSPLMEIVTETEMAKMANIASMYISEACGTIANNEPTWDNLVGMTTIVEGLDSIMKNPAALNYTQAVMLLTVALLSGEGEAGFPY